MTVNLVSIYDALSKGLISADGNKTSNLLLPKHQKQQRFDIHITNREETLLNALAEIFPVVQRLVGEAFFDHMARVFLEKRPPSAPQLLNWAIFFPDFIKAFPAANSLPYLADVALLELTRKRLYQMPEGPCFNPNDIAELSPNQQAQLGFALRPTVALIKSAYPIWAIVQQNLGFLEEGVSISLDDGPDYLLLRRHDLSVAVERLGKADYLFLEELHKGKNITEAHQAVTMKTPDFDMGQALAKAFQQQLFVGDREV